MSKMHKLNQAYEGKTAQEILENAINIEFKDKIAIVSSFGTQAALGLSLVSEVNPSTPVIFLDTIKHFPETLEYRDELISLLKLTDVRIIKPNNEDLLSQDPKGDLCKTNPDECCHIRKVLPLERALCEFDAWITGRKRSHGGGRKDLPLVESDEKHIKINPFAYWSDDDIDKEWKKRDLPEHPMVQFGYTSIGCEPCTQQSSDGRSGRWAQFGKQECGIHK